VELACCGAPGEGRDRLKAGGNRGMAQPCKDRDCAVLHAAVIGKMNFC